MNPTATQKRTFPKIRKSAKGQDCQVRIPGICSHNSETVILAHMGGAGMGMKSPDIHGAYCCYNCHAVVDGEFCHLSRDKVAIYFLEGMVRTQLILIGLGLIKVG